MDIHREGVVWSSLARGHLASFDRRRLERLIETLWPKEDSGQPGRTPDCRADAA
jgi:hypothetical protein